MWRRGGAARAGASHGGDRLRALRARRGGCGHDGEKRPCRPRRAPASRGPPREGHVHGCANACELSVVSFDAERTALLRPATNRCERGLDEPRRRWGGGERAIQPGPLSHHAPNVIADEQRLIASFGNIEQQGSRGSRRIGLMDSMALYAYRPFWRTLLVELGFSVMLPRPGCEADRMSEAWETVPSESACYPAKTSHVRYFSLCEGGCDGRLHAALHAQLSLPGPDRISPARSPPTSGRPEAAAVSRPLCRPSSPTTVPRDLYATRPRWSGCLPP